MKKHELITSVIVENPPKNNLPDTVETFDCPFCSLRCNNLEDLRKHIENVHTSNPVKEPSKNNSIVSKENVTCQMCPSCKFYGSKSELEKHLRLKHGNKKEEPFPCNICG